MKDRFQTLRPAGWPERLQGMFNLNDPRWGRGDDASGQNEPRPDEQRPVDAPRPSEPPRAQPPAECYIRQTVIPCRNCGSGEFLPGYAGVSSGVHRLEPKPPHRQRGASRSPPLVKSLD